MAVEQNKSCEESRGTPDEAVMNSWFPGHMARAGQVIKKYIAGVDLIIEMLDARIPRTSRNPKIKTIIKNKPQIVVLAKYDLAEPKETKAWIDILKADAISCYAVNAETGEGVKDLISGTSRISEDFMLELGKRKRRPRPFRIMVVGIPNVGKSSLINRIAGRKSARTGAKPGITRGKQWIRVGRAIDLLDMPGVLSPGMSDSESLFKLAVTGALDEGSFDRVEVARTLLGILKDKAYHSLVSRFKPDDIEHPDNYKILQSIGKSRGCLGSGGTIDISRAAAIVISEFRKGLLGRITLDSAIDNGLEEKL
ncbi:MAG: ribosome biogenesis GTPase YlqF [Firmicutes bacterium]|nr:ribosome biogenesis GTPase YlqF [Bacillota bacterium]